MVGSTRLQARACGRAAAALRRRAGTHAAPEEHWPLHRSWRPAVKPRCGGLVIVSGLFVRSIAGVGLLLCLLLAAAPRLNLAPFQRHARAERGGYATLSVPSHSRALLKAANLLAQLRLPTSPALLCSMPCALHIYLPSAWQAAPGLSLACGDACPREAGGNTAEASMPPLLPKLRRRTRAA